MSRVTPAERTALEAMLLHGSVKVAASALGKSPRTVEHQLARVRERLDVDSNLQAVRKVFIDRP